MKKLIPLLLVFIFVGCQMNPCGFNKTSFLAKHEYLVDQAKKNKKDWSGKDWESSDEQMKKLLEECYEDYEAEMTNKETSKFWTKTASYYVSRFGRGFLRELKDDDSEVVISLEKGFESIKEDPDEFLRQLLNESGGDEIKDALNELGDELKDLGVEFEKWLNEN